MKIETIEEVKPEVETPEQEEETESSSISDKAVIVGAVSILLLAFVVGFLFGVTAPPHRSPVYQFHRATLVYVENGQEQEISGWVSEYDMKLWEDKEHKSVSVYPTSPVEYIDTDRIIVWRRE